MLSKPIFQSSLGLSLTISISDSLFNATMRSLAFCEESKRSGPWMFTWKNVEFCGIRVKNWEEQTYLKMKAHIRTEPF